MSYKATTRELAVSRYGAIDFASRHWSDQSKWLKLLEIPPEWFPTWYVLDTKMPVKHIACNTDIHGPLYKALEKIAHSSFRKELHTFDGCFNIRMVRGSSHHFSAHAYGLAIDMNVKTNQLGATSGGFFDQHELVSCFTELGFDWGGDFRSRKDPMHFSMAWE